MVVFGCSYSGALSAFFRELYPDLVVGSIAFGQKGRNAKDLPRGGHPNRG